MKVRAFVALAALVLVLPMSGCPAGSTILLGQWLFAMDASSTIFGVAFLANGQMDEFDGVPLPPGATNVYGGELTWQQNGNEITILQDGSAFDRIFTGTLQGSTYMTGTWMNFNGSNGTGTFIATKSPVN